MLAGLLTFAAVYVGAGNASAQDPIDRDALPCWRAFEGTRFASTVLPNRSPLDLDDAMTLFRLHRRREALERIDTARALMKSGWRWRFFPDERAELTESLESFRRCVVDTPPTPLADLTIRTFLHHPGAPGERGPAPPGLVVKVDGLAVGRTGPDGAITLSVPSGPIHVTALRPPSIWGEDQVALPPGARGTSTVVVDDGKEGAEDSQLVLLEAVDDIIPAASTAFTLRFVRDGQRVPIRILRELDALDQNETSREPLDDLFTVAEGDITARDPSGVLQRLKGRIGETITLSVYAVDQNGGMHADRVRFRVGHSRLAVRLEAPPSNPTLPVAGIEVGVSIPGAGIAVQRVSDANGRFEVAALPHGAIAIECEISVGGRFYYGRATAVHAGQREVVLVLRHASDIAAGVPALRPEGARKDPQPRGELGGGRTPRLAVIDVLAAEEGVPVERAATLRVPVGARCVVLSYDAATLERRSVSGHDDVWELAVFGPDGRRLFDVRRTVRSQLHGSPPWQTDGTTGGLQNIFDVASLTSGSDVLMTLAGTAMNVRDSLFPTTVRARLQPAGGC